MPMSRTFDAVTVFALSDGDGPFFDPRTTAFPSAGPELWARADQADPASVHNGQWWLQFRCYALRFDDGRVILVDAGIGPASAPARSWAPVPGTLPAELAAAGIDPAEVDTVVLTHLHTDHIGWSIDEAGAPTFPNARYLLQTAEVATIDDRAPKLADWLLAPLRRTGQLSPVDGALSLGSGVTVQPTPGHTPGHQSVRLSTTDETLLITGDLLVHVLQLLDPDQPYAHEEDPTLARASRIAQLATPGDLILATSHLGQPFLPLPR